MLYRLSIGADDTCSIHGQYRETQGNIELRRMAQEEDESRENGRMLRSMTTPNDSPTLTFTIDGRRCFIYPDVASQCFTLRMNTVEGLIIESHETIEDAQSAVGRIMRVIDSRRPNNN